MSKIAPKNKSNTMRALKKIGIKVTQAGSEDSLYKITARAYLAIILNSVNLNKLIMHAPAFLRGNFFRCTVVFVRAFTFVF